MGYNRVAVEEARGYSGGIWALHKMGSSFTATLNDSMPQCITLTVGASTSSWTCSGIYASPNYPTRCQL